MKLWITDIEYLKIYKIKRFLAFLRGGVFIIFLKNGKLSEKIVFFINSSPILLIFLIKSVKNTLFF